MYKYSLAEVLSHSKRQTAHTFWVSENKCDHAQENRLQRSKIYSEIIANLAKNQTFVQNEIIAS